MSLSPVTSRPAAAGPATVASPAAAGGVKTIALGESVRIAGVPRSDWVSNEARVSVLDVKGSPHVTVSRTDYEPNGVPTFGYSVTINDVRRNGVPSARPAQVPFGAAEGTRYIYQVVSYAVRPGDRVVVDSANGAHSFVVA